MTRRRSILLNGLRLVVAIPGALLWTYAFNLAIAFLFTLRLHAQLSSVLDHSLEAERLNSAFDLGLINETLFRLAHNAPDTGFSSYLGLPVYLLCYFILVPGALFCYRSEAPSRLSILVSSGISYFWRFVRITLLTVVVSAAILGPLLFLQKLWADHVDEHTIGTASFYLVLPGYLLIFLVAAYLRLYFDLVEAYVIALGDQYRNSGKQDRRVHRALLPALRTLSRNFARAYGTFILLALLGLGTVILTQRVAFHTLAQPRTWPLFLLSQLGFFALLLTRFWQRGAETVLVCDFPIPSAPTQLHHYPPDAQPNPEPASPSLDQPDPAVFQRYIPPSPPVE